MEEKSNGSLYCFFARLCNYLQSPLLLLIRLYWGWQFILSGWGKFLNLQTTSEFFSTLNIPFPLFSAYATASVELIGGALFLVGLFSRLAALLLAIVMSVAYWTAHHDAALKIFSDFNTFSSQPPFLFLFATLTVLAFGAGIFSLDAIIRYKNRGKE